MATNAFQRRTSAEKMRGRYFTPAWLADLMVELCQPAGGDLVLDPACGDGVFLRAALRRRLKALRGRANDGRAELVLANTVGLELDAATAVVARKTLRAEFVRCMGRPPRIEPAIGVGDVFGEPRREDGPLFREFQGRTGRFSKGVGLVIGNPPYVEAKRLSEVSKRRLRRRYPDAGTGAVDLFVYFIDLAREKLATNGRLAFVLPNRFLLAAYAQKARQALLDEMTLERVLFLSHLDLFGGAAVYPVVAIARASKPERRERVALSEPATIAATRDACLRPVHVPRGTYQHTQTRAIFPMPDSGAARKLLVRLLEGLSRGRVADVLEIRWTVSFHTAGARDKFVSPQRPVSRHARPFLGGLRFAGNDEVQRYRMRWGGTWIDYDQRRARAAGNPLPPADLFRPPSIVICQNALRLRAAVDRKGYALKDTFLAGRPRASPHPLAKSPAALAALMNSDLVHFFYAHVFHGGHVGGGYLHFLAPYLGDIPLGDWNSARCAAAARRVSRAETAKSETGYRAADRAIQRLVAAAFGLGAAERQIVERFAAPGASRWRNSGPNGWR